MHTFNTDRRSKGTGKIGKNMMYSQYMQLSSCDKKSNLCTQYRDKLLKNSVPRNLNVSSVCVSGLNQTKEKTCMCLIFDVTQQILQNIKGGIGYGRVLHAVPTVGRYLLPKKFRSPENKITHKVLWGF